MPAGRELVKSNRELSAQLRSLRAARKQLEQARVHYIDLFDFAPAMYVLLDKLGMILNVNRAGCRALEVERVQLIGHPLISFAIEADRREVLEHLRRCRSTDRIVESEIRFSSRHGQPITCRLHSKRASYAGHDVFPTIIIDQTERLALDEARLAAERQKDQAERDKQIAQRANATKDRLLAMVSHELRTPLTPALFAASRLASWEGLSDDVRRLAVTVKRNIELEARLIDDLLDVARINRDRIELRLERIDLHEVVGQAVAICHAFAHQSDVSLAVHLAATEHHVNGDSARLRQVFWNLVNNAIKFTAAGGRVVITSVNVGNDLVRVTIRDDGVGMSPATVESLFAAFEHTPRRKDSRGGLGLGLVISKGIVASHHGQLWASSEGPGRGSTFAVELETVAPDVRDMSTDANDISAQGLQSLRVLIVEDDPDSVHMLALFLAQEGCEVEVASTVADGLEKLRERWDVVLSDIGLPDGTGLDIARCAARLPRPPRRLIALTGYSSSDDVKATREAGFDAHVVKPVDLDQLVSTLCGNGHTSRSTSG